MKTTDNQQKSKTSNKTSQKWSIKKKLAVASGAILIFIIGVITIANMATSAPLKVSDEFVLSIQSSKSAAAYDLLSSEVQIETSSQDFAEMVDQIGPILSGKPSVQSKEISAETGSDTSAKIVYEVVGSDKLTYVLTVNLVQENNEWKVLNFESVKKK